MRKLQNLKKNILRIVKKIISQIENAPTNIYLWIFSFSAIIIIRMFVENILYNFNSAIKTSLFYEFTHTFLFFLFSYLIFLWLMKLFLKTTIAQTSNILIFGFIFIILPPILDFIISRGSGYWSFYKFDGIFGLIKRFFTFFGDAPQIGITYGVRIEVALILLLLFGLTYFKTRKKITSLITLIISYCIFFILGTFPSYITIIEKGFQKSFWKINNLDIASMFLSPAQIFSQKSFSLKSALNVKLSLIYALLIIGVIVLGLFLNYRDKLFAFLKNIRPIQIIYHLGLLFIGTGLGIKFTTITWDLDFFNIISFLNIIVAIILAWITSVVVNDISDQKIDIISNKKRPLVVKIFSKQNYVVIGSITFFFSLLLSAIVNPKVAMLLIAYQALAWIYSAQPLRLKRIPILATAISAIASLLIFIAGYILVVPTQDISQLPPQILWLLFISLTISLPIKDLKDIAGDKQNGIKTIPVIFGKYWGKIIISSGIFISYILSVIFLNETKLLWWAILFGGISFWIINIPKNNKYVTDRNLIQWVMAILSVYVVVLYIIIF